MRDVKGSHHYCWLVVTSVSNNVHAVKRFRSQGGGEKRSRRAEEENGKR